MLTTTILNIPNVPASDEIIQKIITKTLPELESAFGGLRLMQEIWLINGINDQILAAAAAGQPLSGYSWEDWTALGTAFTETLISLDTVITSIGKSTKEVMLTRYQQVVVEPVAITPDMSPEDARYVQITGKLPPHLAGQAAQAAAPIELDQDTIDLIKSIFKTK